MTLTRKHLFDLPDGVTYLDGNSLGPLPKGALARAQQVIGQEWGRQLIRAWNDAGWMDLPRQVGDQIAPLIGAPPGSVMTGDTLSLKLYQALAAALQMRPDRRVILSDAGNFPTDLYMAQGLIQTLGQGHQLRLPPPEQVLDLIDDQVAVVMLTHVDYRSGRMHDMQAITARAHHHGAVVIWDLAHSAGALPLDLSGLGAEFAVGCSYKYLNGGPGAPAFIHVRPDLIDGIAPALSGWMGHDAPFAMAPSYQPGAGIERMRIGTPPILQLAVLQAALELWADVDLQALRAASVTLSELFVTEVERLCPALTLVSPRDPARRGSQVSFACDQAHAVMQALIARGVIGDVRPPNLLRFGFTPLYLDHDDIRHAARTLAEVVNSGVWADPAYQTRARVT